MIVTATVRIDLPTEVVDRSGSIVAAVADALLVNESQLVDRDDWTWQYTSNAEYAWANRRTTQPLTGEPFAEEEGEG